MTKESLTIFLRNISLGLRRWSRDLGPTAVDVYITLTSQLAGDCALSRACVVRRDELMAHAKSKHIGVNVDELELDR